MKAEKQTDALFESILADLDLSGTSTRRNGLNYERAVTIWLPEEYKERYDTLQKLTRRQFAEKVRQALQALIRAAESKAS